MKNIKVFKNEHGDFKGVKIGWSWPAIFFSFFWCFYKKLFLLGLTIIIFSILLSDEVYYSFFTNAYVKLAIDIIFLIFFTVLLGKYGNRFVERSLIKRGYRETEVLIAKSIEVVVRRRLIMEGKKNNSNEIYNL